MEFRRNFTLPSTRNHVPFLLPHQQDALSWLKDHPEVVVLSTDKNLGPAIMNRDRYLNLAWRDHLSDSSTYKRLSPDKGRSLLELVYKKILYFLRHFEKSIGTHNFT